MTTEHSGLPEGDVRSNQEFREPKLYRVVLHNDHYTTMDFVIEILVSVFHKPAVEATRIMLDVHKKGKGSCGVYRREFPLKCSLEEA
jgi:ATP-dependent Clp protease adaptor protein ClpS